MHVAEHTEKCHVLLDISLVLLNSNIESPGVMWKPRPWVVYVEMSRFVDDPPFDKAESDLHLSLSYPAGGGVVDLQDEHRSLGNLVGNAICEHHRLSTRHIPRDKSLPTGFGFSQAGVSHVAVVDDSPVDGTDLDGFDVSIF